MVRDSGIGIPPARMDRLFKPFSQVDASTSRRYGGTGLGLAISQRLCELMGGRMWVESRGACAGNSPKALKLEDSDRLWQNYEGRDRGSQTVESDEQPQNPKSKARPQDEVQGQQNPKFPGSTFYFTIVAPGYPVAMPTREQGSAKGNRPLPELTPEMRQLAQQIPLRILLAEDNKVNQQVALLTLKQLGYQADVVSNGHEVLEALRRQPYDVVLMDVEMPQMDGLMATRVICQEWSDKRMKSQGTRINEHSSLRLHPSSFKKPRIIAMTAYAMAGDRQKCLEAGMDDYISKPIQEKELIRALQLCQSEAIEPRKQLTQKEHKVGTPNLESQPVLDQRVLKSLRQMAGAKAATILCRIIENYLEDAPQLLQNIRDAVAAGDASALRQSAHTLRSSSANLGAMNLSNLCKELEMLGRAGTTTDAPDHMAQVEAEYEKVKVALQLENEQISS